MRDRQLAKRIARAVNSRQPQRRTETDGVARIVNGRTMVLLPGAESPTPCRSTVTLNDGDRVTVRIDGHRATVTGNMTNRAVDGAAFQRGLASVAGASNYIEPTPDGLLIGDRKEDGSYDGYQLLAGNDAFYLLDEGGEVAAYFGKSKWSGSESPALDVFSGTGVVRIRSSRFEELPDGIAGAAMRVEPPTVEIRDRTVDDGGEEVFPASISLAVEYDPEGMEPGNKRRTSISVSPGRVDVEGDLYVNGIRK